MLLGADVSHPPPGNQTRPSLATLVGSIDRCATRYVATARNQTHREEVIEGLDSMVKSCTESYMSFQSFHKAQNAVPETIIYFRDGVSEGQFGKVLDEELPQIRKGLAQLNIPAEQAEAIRITVCIVRYVRHVAGLMTESGTILASSRRR